jgi:hypothetical protein
MSAKACAAECGAESLTRSGELGGRFLADGVLVDVSVTAREAGLRWPVALTGAVWERCVAVPPGVVYQDEAGRLWDVCWMLACAARRTANQETIQENQARILANQQQILANQSRIMTQ